MHQLSFKQATSNREQHTPSVSQRRPPTISVHDTTNCRTDDGNMRFKNRCSHFSFVTVLLPGPSPREVVADFTVTPICQQKYLYAYTDGMYCCHSRYVRQSMYYCMPIRSTSLSQLREERELTVHSAIVCETGKHHHAHFAKRERADCTFRNSM